MRSKLRGFLNNFLGRKTQSSLTWKVQIGPDHDRPIVLFLVLEGTGGTLLHTTDLTRGLWPDYRVLCLSTGQSRWELTRYNGVSSETVMVSSFKQPWRFENTLDDDRLRVLQDVLDRCRPTLVHIHHLIGTAPEVIGVIKSAGVPAIYSFHDYYALCPAFHLLDNNLTFCRGHCTEGDGVCKVFLNLPQHPHLKHAYVHEWRKRVRECLRLCDRLVSFTEGVRETVLKHYPQIDPSKYLVIPHGQDFLKRRPISTTLSNHPIRVVVPGHLSITKGSDTVRKIAAINDERKGPFEFHFLGKVDESLISGLRGVVVHGQYSHEDLPSLFEEIRPSFAVIASLWGETFSYVLSECWAYGIPVFGTALGALKERIESAGGGWLMPPGDPEHWYSEMLRLAKSQDEYNQCIENIDGLHQRDLTAMTSDYKKIYSELVAHR